ncbi:hypothetical protein IGK74_002330 [Enterococcus sp. AZ150]|uniref:hypothetical protein n=1 Tax=Enterococcus sp. AZ150 TaxID=2774866 RepID=UPI003F209DEB
MAAKTMGIKLNEFDLFYVTKILSYFEEQNLSLDSNSDLIRKLLEVFYLLFVDDEIENRDFISRFNELSNLKKEKNDSPDIMKKLNFMEDNIQLVIYTLLASINLDLKLSGKEESISFTDIIHSLVKENEKTRNSNQTKILQAVSTMLREDKIERIKMANKR